MNYTEQYIKVLKIVNESSSKFHIREDNNNYSDSDKRLLIELINDGYANGKPQCTNKKINILEITPTVKGRIFQDDLIQKQKNRDEILFHKEMEQHRLLKSSFFWNKVLVIITLLMTLATWTLVVLEWKLYTPKDRDVFQKTNKKGIQEK